MIEHPDQREFVCPSVSLLAFCQNHNFPGEYIGAGLYIPNKKSTFGLIYKQKRYIHVTSNRQGARLEPVETGDALCKTLQVNICYSCISHYIFSGQRLGAAYPDADYPGQIYPEQQLQRTGFNG